MPKKLRFIFLFALIFLFSAGASKADMSSDNFRIRFGNFNMTSGRKTSGSYTLTDTVGQTAAGEFNSAGYTVKAGFQYIYTFFPFSFRLSSLSIDFGTLSLNSFVTRSHTITVSAPGQGYTVTAVEDHPLQNRFSNVIPDTTCDTGTCNQSTAGIWTNATANGFGFNMSGHDIPVDFVDNTYFRQFADASTGEDPGIVMTSAVAGRDRQSTVTYKVSIGGSQAAGEYENLINYIATPVY